MLKITLLRIGRKWKAYFDDDETLFVTAGNAHDALDLLAMVIKKITK